MRPKLNLAPTLSILFVLILALPISLLSTRWGIGIMPDSVSYLDLRGTGAGYGGFGPMYTWIVSLISTDANVLDRAKWLAIALLALNISLVWFVVYRSTESALASLLAGLLLISSNLTLKFHLHASSEGLFIAFTLLCLIFLSYFLETGQRRFLLLTAGTAAATTLTRFAGVPLVGLGVLCIVLLGRDSVRNRLLQSIGFSVIAGAPLAIWLWYSKISGGPGTGRKLELLGNPDTDVFLQGVRALTNYLVPSAVPLYAQAALLIVLMYILAYMTYRYVRLAKQSRAVQAIRVHLEMIPYVSLLYIGLYLAFLVLSVFIEANLPLYQRYMAPIYVVSIPLFIILARKTIFAEQHRAWIRNVTVAAVALLMITHSARAGKWVFESHRDGLGYASPHWQQSAIIDKVKMLDPAIPIYTNGEDAIVALIGRSAFMIPEKFYRRTGKDHEISFEVRLEEMRADMVRRDAVIVLFDRVTWRFYLPSEEELLAKLPLRKAVEVNDGRIYKIDN